MAASRVASGILVSRALGLVRERVFAHYFGNGPLADAWKAALRVPNVLQNLLGEGSLSASFIPVYARLLENGEEREAGRVAGAVLGLLASTAGALALVGSVAAPVLVRAVAPGFTGDGREEIFTVVVRLLFPMAALLVISAWSLSILNTHRRFFVSYVAPAFWNLAMISVLIAAAGREVVGTDLLVALAWGALAGGAAQLLFHVPFLARHMRHVRLSLNVRAAAVRRVVRNIIPVVLARGGVNLSALLDTALASLLATGAVGMLAYAQTLYLLPISVFGMSVAAAALPELARDRETGLAKVGERTEGASRTVLYWMIPIAAGYVALSGSVMAVYETGQFGGDDVSVTGWVLAAYALGLPASGTSRTLASAFYAVGDTRRPASIALVRIALSAVVGVALMFPLDRIQVGELRLGAVGLAGGAAAGAWVELGLLRSHVRRQWPGLRLGGGRLLRYAFSTALSIGVGLLLHRLTGSMHPLVAAAATILPVGVTYVFVTTRMGISPLRWVGGRGDPETR